MAYDIAFSAQVIRRLRFTVLAAVAALTQGRAYWQDIPEGAAYPIIVVQSQDRGGAAANHVGENGWTGLLMFRVLSRNPDEAETLLAAIPALVASLSVDGYALEITLDRPYTYPVEESDGRMFTAACLAQAALA